jgi:hypothetical protein
MLRLGLPWEGTSPGNPSFIDRRRVVDSGRLVFDGLIEGWTEHQLAEDGSTMSMHSEWRSVVGIYAARLCPRVS